MKASSMPFCVRFNIRKPVVKARADDEEPASRSSVVWLAHSSSVHFENSNEQTVKQQLITGMEKALELKRRVRAGEKVTPDKVQWWRCYSRKNAKLVVGPVEKRQKQRKRHQPAPAPAPAPASVPIPAEERNITRTGRALTWVLLLSLLGINLMKLVIAVYIAVTWKD